MKADPWFQIYEHNIWNGVDSLSGPGSGAAATRQVAADIVKLVQEFKIESVLDVACGDGYWMPDLPNYVGIDVAPQAIKRAKVLNPEREYILGDFLTTDLRADLIIMRDVLQHLSLEVARQMVRRARLRSRFLLASTYEKGKNTGLSYEALLKGRAFDNDLERPPFSLGPPLLKIFDGYAYEGVGVRDARKHLGLWSTS